LPGQWAQEQLNGSMAEQHKSRPENTRQDTPLQKALAAERAQHEYWEQWQGVTPGTPVYEDPRAFQNTLLPVAKYGTEGRGYG